MAANFDRVFPFRGWDKDATPVKWQMVPVSATDNRYLYLHDGAGLTVSSNNAAVTVTEIRLADLPGDWDKRPALAGDRVFKLTGASKGTARIEAKNAARTLITEIEASTKNKLTKKVTFYFVRDTATPPHHTTRAPAEAAEWVRVLNYIFRQANIEIVSPAGTRLTFAGTLGNPLRWVDGTTDDWAKLRGVRDAGADHTFFQIWEYEQPSAPNTTTGAGTLAVDKMTVCDNRTPAVHSHVIAHEQAMHLGSRTSVQRDPSITSCGI